MNFDWSKPMDIDWSGRTRIISQEDINNSVINRILRNKFYAPFCEREIIRMTPWWDPDDPFGFKSGNSHPDKDVRYIPGLHTAPRYPQLSSLSRQTHQQCLRVLAAEHDVYPRDYPQPTDQDYHSFDEIKEIYENEQKDYIKWAKKSWVNGDCIRALRPKPIIEHVYEAEFKMRAHEIYSLPQNYTMAAQLSLETKYQEFELEHKQDLINVDIEDLPIVNYPDEINSYLSVLKQCPLPEPCAKHPCKFVLPRENLVSNLPLTEINYELAQYAIGNGVSFIASENALQCLLETERSWKIPVSVIEVISPDGDSRNVTVLGSEFGVQKECAQQRTYKAYKHLLRYKFAPSTGHYMMKTSTQETATSSTSKLIEETAPRFNRFESLDEDLAVSSDDDNRLQIYDDDPKSDCSGDESEMYESDGEPNESEGESGVTYETDYTNITEAINDIKIDDNNDITNDSTKSNIEKTSTRELFGTVSESDSEEAVKPSIANRKINFYNAISDNNKEDSVSNAFKIFSSNNEPSNESVYSNEGFAEPNTINSSFINTISIIEKSALNPISRKRSYPSASDPELMYFSEPEEPLAGFVDGVAVLAKQLKNNQVKSDMYTHTDDSNEFEYSPCSYRISLASTKGKTNQQTKTENVGLRSRREEEDKKEEEEEEFSATNNTDSEEEFEKEVTQSEDTSVSEDPSVMSLTEEEKIKETDRNEMHNTLNKTDNVTNDKPQNILFSSTSSEGQKSHQTKFYMAASSQQAINSIIGVHNCTCKGTLFEIPPPRSFKKWQLRNSTSNVNINIIIHSSHKAMKDMQEVLLEPIVEYQPEMGGAKQSAGKIRALALSLMLRESAQLINVRLDYENGSVIVVDKLSSEQFAERHGDLRGDVANSLHTTLNQLRYLMPGQYVLTHDSCHGANAMLFTTKGIHCAGAEGSAMLCLRQGNINMPHPQEIDFARVPPELGPTLLPYHKYRSILPLAFTPRKLQAPVKKTAAALAKAKLPPSSIQWPKKMKKSKNTRQSHSGRGN